MCYADIMHVPVIMNCTQKETLLPKNCPQAIGNINKCSMSEALDESVPGAWLG